MGETKETYGLTLPDWVSAEPSTEELQGTKFQVELMEFAFSYKKLKPTQSLKTIKEEKFKHFEKQVSPTTSLSNITSDTVPSDFNFTLWIEAIETVIELENFVSKDFSQKKGQATFSEEEMQFFERFNDCIAPIFYKPFNSVIDSATEHAELPTNMVDYFKAKNKAGNLFHRVSFATERSAFSTSFPNLTEFNYYQKNTKNQEDEYSNKGLESAKERLGSKKMAQLSNNDFWGLVPSDREAQDLLTIYTCRSHSSMKQIPDSIWGEVLEACETQMGTEAYKRHLESVQTGRNSTNRVHVGVSPTPHGSRGYSPKYSSRTEALVINPGSPSSCF